MANSESAAGDALTVVVRRLPGCPSASSTVEPSAAAVKDRCFDRTSLGQPDAGSRPLRGCCPRHFARTFHGLPILGTIRVHIRSGGPPHDSTHLRSRIVHEERRLGRLFRRGGSVHNQTWERHPVALTKPLPDGHRIANKRRQFLARARRKGETPKRERASAFGRVLNHSARPSPSAGAPGPQSKRPTRSRRSQSGVGAAAVQETPWAGRRQPAIGRSTGGPLGPRIMAGRPLRNEEKRRSRVWPVSEPIL
jgi:hypothetical protein